MFFLNCNVSYLLFGFFLVSLIACEREQTQTTLYNIDSVINAQSATLARKKAVLHKEAFVGTGKDDTTFTPATDSLWSAELDMFRKMSAVNKPASKESYIIDDDLFDVSSNLTVKAISAVSDDMPVRYIRIFYDKDVSVPRKVEALYDDRNDMYASGKILTMDFQQVDNENVLTGYSIQGGQKMIFGDSVTYVIRGKIVIK